MRMAALRRQGGSSQPLIGQPGARNAPVLAQPGVASNAAVVQEGSLDVAAVVPAEDFDRANLQQLGVGSSVVVRHRGGSDFARVIQS